MPAPDSPSFYKRSGFIHPLYSPDGSILTDDFPVGHAHQHAIFTAWTNTTFRNKPVDFWNQHLQKGTVQHVAVVGIKEGPVFSELKTELKYISFEHGTVLKEFWTLRFYPFNDYYIFDLESEQQNATTDTLYLNPYHYGGLAFRGSREWNPDDKKFYRLPWNILTSEGLRDSSANQTHARWVDASGDISGKESGACVLNHVSNFRYPQGIRVHPQMPYWCFAPVIDGGFSIPPGAFYRSRYRYYVHKGKPDAAVIESFQKSWSAINQTSE